MPFTPPEDQAPSEDASEDTHSRYEKRRQELQVRLTAQRILGIHLDPETAVFWADIDLDLAEAYLHQFNLAFCQVRMTRFDGAKFAGDAEFRRATFAGIAMFRGTEFTGAAKFGGAKFTGDTDFRSATFVGDARFSGAEFFIHPKFDEARVALNRSVDLPMGWITRTAQQGEDEHWLYMFDEDWTEQPTESTDGGEGQS